MLPERDQASPPIRRWKRRLTLATLLVALVPGCTRKFFRQCADDDVTGLITQKNVFPDWKVENWHIYPDPRARFADMSNPDRPTFPPDDYAAHRLSPNPQQPRKKIGVGRVDGEGYMKFLEGWDAENRALAKLEGDKDGGAIPLPIPTPVPGEPIKPEPIAAPKSAMLPEALIPSVQPPEGVSVSQEEPPIKLDGEVKPAALVEPLFPPPAESEEIWGPAKPGVKPVSRVESSRPDGVAQKSPKANAISAKPKLDAVGPRKLDLPAKDLLKTTFRATAAQIPEPLQPGNAEPSPVDVVARPEDYLKSLATNMDGYRLTMNQAVELGVFNSREFQDQREALYNAALPVTLERYQFAAQAFFAETIVRESIGPDLAGGPNENWQIGTNTGFGRIFPTGGQLLVSLANQFVIDLTNGQPYLALSNLSLTLSQPLLQGGGFAVTLEPLTQAERTLLYAIRSYARYRKLFYVAITAGGSYTNNPYGLTGLSVNLGRGIGGNLTAPSVGFLPTILQAATVANQQKNIVSLQQLLKLYQAFREGGMQSDLQVGQVEQQLITSQSRLLGSSTATTSGGSEGSNTGIRGLLDGLDSFKLQLGVPFTVSLSLDDGPLKPVRQQLARFEDVYADLQDMENEARKFNPGAPVVQFRPRWRELLTNSRLTRGTSFATAIQTRWAVWEKLTDDRLNARLAAIQDERRKLLDQKTDREIKGLPEDTQVSDRLLVLNADIDLAHFEQAMRGYEAQPWVREKEPLRGSLQAGAFRDVFNTFYQLILEARNDRLARIRGQWPKLPGLTLEGQDLLAIPMDDAYGIGVRTALSQRLDLMNTRGQVVDSWRQIKVTANGLQGVLNVQYDLNSFTPDPGGNPFAFSTQRSEQQLSVNAELPLIRRAERNAYRSALIAYQGARRRLMSFEDNIANDVRADIRELRVIAEQYRLQQRLIELGYSQFDNAQALLIAPPAPGAQTDAGSAAALTQQVLQAQTNLLTAQNNLYQLWVNYLISRMQFYLDVEQMPLDARGVWIDDAFSPSESTPQRADPVRERLAAPKQ